ncbi:membrane protein [Streptomyces sp. NRRL F-5123]|uniref:membrane protein n=1 Tax=Streptomyces sp. NRRL F-5123 TaxID=1463856 RepID=UPI0004E212D8|nr:membrane protein [Streptomyces sp. NRRL F-5123]
MALGPRETPQGRDSTADSYESHASQSTDGVPSDGAERTERLDEPPPLEPLGDPMDLLDPMAAMDPALPLDGGQSFRELRPQRRLRIWQLAPIVALAVAGSLMFAFPLAFESGDAGPVVAMLGLLLCGCSAGWGLTAARRVGYTWPGLPARGSGTRVDWRYVAGYAVLILLLAALAVWRVARLG